MSRAVAAGSSALCLAICATRSSTTRGSGLADAAGLVAAAGEFLAVSAACCTVPGAPATVAGVAGAAVADGGAVAVVGGAAAVPGGDAATAVPVAAFAVADATFHGDVAQPLPQTLAANAAHQSQFGAPIPRLRVLPRNRRPNERPQCGKGVHGHCATCKLMAIRLAKLAK